MQKPSELLDSCVAWCFSLQASTKSRNAYYTSQKFYPSKVEKREFALLSICFFPTVLTGIGKKEDLFIPKIPLIPTDLPFEFKWLQSPVRLSKIQGQYLKIAGLNLTILCFSHGQTILVVLGLECQTIFL